MMLQSIERTEQQNPAESRPYDAGPGAGKRWPNYSSLVDRPKTYNWLVVKCRLSDATTIPAGLPHGCGLSTHDRCILTLLFGSFALFLGFVRHAESMTESACHSQRERESSRTTTNTLLFLVSNMSRVRSQFRTTMQTENESATSDCSAVL
jgi:hypothetical protein